MARRCRAPTAAPVQLDRARCGTHVSRRQFFNPPLWWRATSWQSLAHLACAAVAIVPWLCGAGWRWLWSTERSPAGCSALRHGFAEPDSAHSWRALVAAPHCSLIPLRYYQSACFPRRWPVSTSCTQVPLQHSQREPLSGPCPRTLPRPAHPLVPPSYHPLPHLPPLHTTGRNRCAGLRGAWRHLQVAGIRASLSWCAVRLLRQWLCSSEHGGRLGCLWERGCAFVRWRSCAPLQPHSHAGADGVCTYSSQLV